MRGMAALLSEFVALFAAALNAADSRRPTAVSPRSGRIYQPGISPHPEDRAVDLAVGELAEMRPAWQIALRQCYPSSKQTCDLLWGDPPEWPIEIRCFARTATTGSLTTPRSRTSCRRLPRIAVPYRIAKAREQRHRAAPGAADLRV